MAKDVKMFVRECSTCQENKYFNQKLMGLLQPLPIPLQVWEDIAMNFTTHLPLPMVKLPFGLLLTNCPSLHTS